MALGDRLNSQASTEVKQKAAAGKPIPSGEIIDAVAVEAADGLPALSIIQGPQALPGFNIPPYDTIVLSYVAAGNGMGEIETAVYKVGGVAGSTVATITLSYNASNEIATVVKT